MKRVVVLLLVCVAATSLTAQTKAQPKAPASAPKATAPAAPKKEKAVPFKPGEVLEFDIGWSSFLTAGTAVVSVKEKKPSYGSTAYYIVAEGRPTPLVSKLYTLYYKADTLLDTYSLLPQRGSLFSKEGKRQRMKTTVFNQAAKSATYEVQTRTLVKRTWRSPPSRRMRCRRSTCSDRFRSRPARSSTCRSPTRAHLQGADAGRRVEPVKTGLGTINGLKIVPVITGPERPSPRGLALWLSDDARRLPLKMEAQLAVGKFTVTLQKASGA